MSSQKNTSLKKAAADLSQVLNSSHSANQDCIKALANIEEIINAIEHKLNGKPDQNNASEKSNEAISFAPEMVTTQV